MACFHKNYLLESLDIGIDKILRIRCSDASAEEVNQKNPSDSTFGAFIYFNTDQSVLTSPSTWFTTYSSCRVSEHTNHGSHSKLHAELLCLC